MMRGDGQSGRIATVTYANPNARTRAGRRMHRYLPKLLSMLRKVAPELVWSGYVDEKHVIWSGKEYVTVGVCVYGVWFAPEMGNVWAECWISPDRYQSLIKRDDVSSVVQWIYGSVADNVLIGRGEILRLLEAGLNPMLESYGCKVAIKDTTGEDAKKRFTFDITLTRGKDIKGVLHTTMARFDIRDELWAFCLRATKSDTLLEESIVLTNTYSLAGDDEVTRE